MHLSLTPSPCSSLSPHPAPEPPIEPGVAAPHPQLPVASFLPPRALLPLPFPLSPLPRRPASPRRRSPPPPRRAPPAAAPPGAASYLAIVLLCPTPTPTSSTQPQLALLLLSSVLLIKVGRRPGPLLPVSPPSRPSASAVDCISASSASPASRRRRLASRRPLLSRRRAPRPSPRLCPRSAASGLPLPFSSSSSPRTSSPRPF